jgi:hypothetical protein
MPDITFDAVIVGGGNKSLLLALYLMKYGGMSVTTETGCRSLLSSQTAPDLMPSLKNTHAHATVLHQVQSK